LPAAITAWRSSKNETAERSPSRTTSCASRPTKPQAELSQRTSSPTTLKGDRQAGQASSRSTCWGRLVVMDADWMVRLTLRL